MRIRLFISVIFLLFVTLSYKMVEDKVYEIGDIGLAGGQKFPK